MKNLYRISIILVLMFLSWNMLSATSSLVSRIPNGSKFSCQTCHTSVPSRNAFGNAFKNNGSRWNATLAKLDSDGDGFTNGTELQDPNGTWTSGSIGDVSLVTNPGDATSKPQGTGIDELFCMTGAFIGEVAAYPNPAVNLLKIDIDIHTAVYVKVNIISASGTHLRTLYSNYCPQSKLVLNWDMTDNNGQKLSRGVYLISIETSSGSLSKKILIAE